MQASQSCTASQNIPQVRRFVSLAPDRQHQDLDSATPQLMEEMGLLHDARNLLGALGLYADILASPGVLADQNRFYAAEIKLIAERSLRLIERLVMSTGMQRGQTLTKIAHVLNNSVGVLNRVARCTVKPVVHIPSHASVCVPAEVIERILLNLVKNAAAAGTSLQSICVSLTQAGGHEPGSAKSIVMTVKDEGVGMNPLQVQMIHDGTLARGQGGRGVGLRIVRELALNSGGSLKISSAPGKGTQVSVSWPEAEESAPVELVAKSSQTPRGY